MMIWVGSTEYIPAKLTKVPGPLPDDSVEYCFSTSRKQPKIADPGGGFDSDGTAEIETDANGDQTAQCLYDGGTTPLALGQYFLWLQITSGDEVVIFPVDDGEVEIYGVAV